METPNPKQVTSRVIWKIICIAELFIYHLTRGSTVLPFDKQKRCLQLVPSFCLGKKTNVKSFVFTQKLLILKLKFY